MTPANAQLSSVSALSPPPGLVRLRLAIWALVVVLVLLARRKQWAWLAAAVRQPRVLGAFALSAVLLSGNWLTYVWAVQNQHVVDASLGYFILPLVNVALGFVFHELGNGSVLVFGHLLNYRITFGVHGAGV